MRSNAVDGIVIDPVAALVPRAEIEGEMGHSSACTRLMSQALRKLIVGSRGWRPVTSRPDPREDRVMFGNPETTTGGRALKFYTSVRLDIRKIGQLKEGEEVIGNRTKVTVVKNKVAPPFRKAEFDILFAQGISREGELLEIGTNTGAILKSGTWFSMKHATDGEIRLGQGLERARRFLLDNRDLAAELERAIRATYVPTSNAASVETDEDSTATPASAPAAAKAAR